MRKNIFASLFVLLIVFAGLAYNYSQELRKGVVNTPVINEQKGILDYFSKSASEFGGEGVVAPETFNTGSPALPKVDGAISEPALVSLPKASIRQTGWWVPELTTKWQIQFADANVNFSTDATLFDLDMYDTTALQIVDAHKLGKRVICYVNAGSWEDWRADKDDFPKSVIGSAYEGWPGENWLDIREINLLAPIISKRIEMCAMKGFDGIEFDNVNAFENDTGFPLSYNDQLKYNKWLASESHKYGLAVGLKNDSSQVADLVGDFDFAITESCAAEGWCEDFSAFVSAGKPVLVIEFKDTISSAQFQNYCKKYPNGSGYNLILKKRNLDAGAEWCK